MTPHQRYEEFWREPQLCDELGFDFGFCVEHLFRPDESSIWSPSLYVVGAGARTRHWIGPMAMSCRSTTRCVWPKKSRSLIRLSVGGWSSGWFRESIATISSLSALITTAEIPDPRILDYLRAAYGEKQPFAFQGDVHRTESAELAVAPFSKPHHTIWMMSRDPQTLEFCPLHGINPRIFFDLSACRRGATL